MKTGTLAGLAISALSAHCFSQSLALDFNDPGWTNDTTGLSSEFQSNGGGSGNFAGWDSTHSIAPINGTGIGTTLSINQKVHAWNIENRPALAPCFPSSHGTAGDILRSWNDEANLDPGQIPSFTLIFSGSICLDSFGLEGFRQGDAWRITAYDESGNAVAPNWADPNLATITAPGDPLGNTAINILSTSGVNGTTGAEALGPGRYDAVNNAFIIWNTNNILERGAAILDYNGTKVSSIVYEMIEVDTLGGEFVGTPADQSMYIGSGLLFQPIPEPGISCLPLLAGLGLARRKRT